MNLIVFIDTEIEPKSERVLDIGSIKDNGSLFHSNSTTDFLQFLHGAQYICGHNIINHDLKYLQNELKHSGFDNFRIIDTLYLSPLLFPTKPYHALVKDDKLQTDDINNPLNDAIKSKNLFWDEVSAFQRLDNTLKQIFFLLLKDKKEFGDFFRYIGYGSGVLGLKLQMFSTNIEKIIIERFKSKICEYADLSQFISRYPIELSYCLALINSNSRYSITPPWVLKNYPEVERIMFLLRNKPCLSGCEYCNYSLDIHRGLKTFFGFDSYRTYAGEPLQEKAVKAAVDNKSLLAVFPTGGGKSITFQVPALMSGINTKGLTVVISPLQSLMKDQVDNLEKVGITEAVTINGLLDPIERAKSFERVENGSASILYISPESLRSKTIEHLLLGRNVVRFVIDEAHCFSSWGQDFRVDYLYIGDFIKALQQKKNMEQPIPVSCFTATAKQNVIEDIRSYFMEKLSIELELFTSSASRSNLRYKVFQKTNEEEKYNKIRDLIEEKKCPTIIYVSRTSKADQLAQKLRDDGYQANSYHGKMDKQMKTENQNAFIKGEVQIMVATSAFGMGVDKKDIGMVIHYDISDSLENYVQEAGRAGRDDKITADCFVLFDDEDLNKHFILLNQTKLNIEEIQQVWRAIKNLTKIRSRVSQSALEIARKAGWDESIGDVETKVKTAIQALEDAGYIKRGQNMPRIFASSILAKNAEEANNKIRASSLFDDESKEKAIRIVTKLISSRSRKSTRDQGAEDRVDYISDLLGIEMREVIHIINLLREERILADMKDLSAYIKQKENINRSLSILKSHLKIEEFLLNKIEKEEQNFNLKELNEEAEKAGCKDINPNKLISILNIWTIKNWIKKQNISSKDHVVILGQYEKEVLKSKLTIRYEMSHFILEYLFRKINKNVSNMEEVLVEFSVCELRQAYENKLTLLQTKITVNDIEDALFYLSKIEAIKIEGGFLVTYNGMDIQRIELDNKKRYKIEDYQKLKQYYDNKIQQIHVVGEYAKKMISDYKEALTFVDDYFKLNYASFLEKYFNGSRQNEITQNITPAKFKQLFGELSPTQLKIITDKESKYILVAAGPGSGKTRVLVHKLASLFFMEDVKHEQLLMLTFSRAAATEFKKRLIKLIGNAANFVEIKTFHSYCFDLLGKVGTIEKSDEIIKETVTRIQNGEVEPGRITKAVLVIDEAQDMDSNEFELIMALIEHNEDMRVIAVEDDDQNIYEFRGASSNYIEQLIKDKNAVMYELLDNYRSKSNLVDFTNQFVTKISKRLKSTPITPIQKDNGKIKLVRYSSNNLITPLVKDVISEEIVGTTCVLTDTNEQALQITGLLLEKGIQAKLIQSNDGFNLYNLLEIRYFLHQLKLSEEVYVIDGESWAKAKKSLTERFRNSPNYETCSNIIKDFEMTNTNYKYKSDLYAFIRESKLEDFLTEKVETIFISTIHKSKGREFDNVFIMLGHVRCETDEDRRKLYVAMTRAKRNLIIHCNESYLDYINTQNCIKMNDYASYSVPCKIVMQLTFKDVWLDFFETCQPVIRELTSGDELIVNGESCFNSKSQQVLRFSKQFTNKMENLKIKSYKPVTAKIRFIILWKKENAENEIRIVLPEIFFERGE